LERKTSETRSTIIYENHVDFQNMVGVAKINHENTFIIYITIYLK